MRQQKHTPQHAYNVMRESDLLCNVHPCFCLSANDNIFCQEYQYDNRGRIEKTIDVLSTSLKHESSKTYDAVGNIQTTTDAELNVTKYDYDNLNRLTTITYPDLTTRQYTYDNRDNLLTVTNEKEVVVRSYTYDRKNRLNTEVWPTTKFTESKYDANNNLIEMVDNKGQVTKNRYDDANRLDLKTYFINAAATAAVKTVSFSYNNANTLTGYDDGTTSAVYTLDDLQRKIAETVNFGTFSKTLSTSYYKNSLKKTFTDTENIINTYLYDAGNRLSQISIPSEGSIIFNRYHWNSPEKITYPGGLTRTISYDPIMRTKHINNSDSASNSLMDYDYGYDKVGNIKTKSTEHGNYAYGYDARYRLETVDNPVVPSVSSLVDEAYTYDDAGNHLTDASTTGDWVYNTTNQLTSNSALSIDYDDNGSTIKKTKAGVITTFDYNTENRLSTVKDNAGATVATYYYDPFGRRLYKEVAGTRTYFMYAAEGLIAELDSAGNVTQSYGYTPQSTYGTSPLYTKTSVGYAYYQLDHLGTPQQLVNKTGLVVWKAKSKSFGDTTVEVNTVTNNLRFPGQYFDQETGTHYNYFRDYEPGTGRYVQSDPIGLGGGMNAYGYVGGNPLSYSDPLGLTPNPAEGACTLGPNPVCIAGVIVDVITTAVGFGIIMDSISDDSVLPVPRPKDMSKLEERNFGRYCSGSDDHCAALKAATNRAIITAKIKQNNLLRDEFSLFIHAFDTANQLLTGSTTTWMGHVKDLRGKVNNINSMISLGIKMGCDMRSEIAQASTLYVPTKPLGM